MKEHTAFFTAEGRCETRSGDNRKVTMPEGVGQYRVIVFDPERGWWGEKHDFDGRHILPFEITEALANEFHVNKQWGANQ